MFLFVWPATTSPNAAKQVRDNLTVGDLLAVSQGRLSIFRFSAGRFERLVIAFGEAPQGVWEPVEDAQTISCQMARFHV